MTLYDLHACLSDGTRIPLSTYRGHVLLIVNTASNCSYSRQFSGLQRLFDDYHAHGFTVLGFPCNQFNEKEPDSNADIRRNCQRSFGVSFPLFEKTAVRGPDMHPLFRLLTEQAPFQGFDPATPNALWMEVFLQQKHPEIYLGDGVKWNFSKFLLDRSGKVIARFETTVEPVDIAPHIEALL